MDGLRLDEILVKKLTGRKKVFRLDIIFFKEEVH
jgi:hypothetical protein